LGTAYYLAPEQLQGRIDIDVRADLYAVGMIIYELLTGEIAQGRFKLPGKLIDNIPKELDKIVDMALSPRPDERYVSAEVMRAALPAIAPLSTDPNYVSIDVADLFCHSCGTLLKDNYFKCKNCGEINCNNCQDIEKRGWCLECRDISGEGMPTAAKSALTSNFEIEQYRNKKPFSIFENSLGMKFVLIPPGTFMMGSPPDESDPLDGELLHKVTLTKSFYMQTTPVTQAQWESVMEINRSHFKDSGGDCPVEDVSWDDAKEFISRVNKKEISEKYRLPTEAEWEYACRAGSTTAYCFGDSEANLSEYAWYKINSEDRTHPVGQKKPNAWGLYDMHGNVLEWCQDWWRDYPSGSVTNPSGNLSGWNRVLRGGCWYKGAEFCRSAVRIGGSPGKFDYDRGFRLARSQGILDYYIFRRGEND
jgi:formylglycine-generating enzyme required for sulfatase activity